MNIMKWVVVSIALIAIATWDLTQNNADIFHSVAQVIQGLM